MLEILGRYADPWGEGGEFLWGPPDSDLVIGHPWKVRAQVTALVDDRDIAWLSFIAVSGEAYGMGPRLDEMTTPFSPPFEFGSWEQFGVMSAPSSQRKYQPRLLTSQGGAMGAISLLGDVLVELMQVREPRSLARLPERGSRTEPGPRTLSGADAHYQRLLRLALELGERASFEPALREAVRRKDHKTGRLLLSRFDREGVGAAVPEVPPTFDPLVYRGVRLLWDHPTAVLFSACVAEHVLYIFEELYPQDIRPRAAIEASRAFVRGDIDAAARAAATYDGAWAAAWAAWDARGAAAAAYAAGDAARAASRAAAWAAADAGDAGDAAAYAAYAAGDAAAGAAHAAATYDGAWAAYDAEHLWQRGVLLQYLLGEMEDVRCAPNE